VKTNISNNPIAILGGGVSGLAAALTLLEKGEKVVLIEKNVEVGGSASSIDIPEKRKIPVCYHQIVGSDIHLLRFLKKLGLFTMVKWKKVNISSVINDQYINLASPKDILILKILSLSSRLKYLLFGLRCLTTRNWSSWEKKSVTEFIRKWADEEILSEIVKPLVSIKFGFSTDQADAAWLGRRLSHREGNTPFGYIPNTSWTFEMCQVFVRSINSLGGVLMVNTSVRSFIRKGKKIDCVITDRGVRIPVKAVVSTLPPPVLCRLLIKNHFPNDWILKLEGIKYISCYSLLAGLPTVPFKDYWTVILKPRKIFGACFNISLLNDTLVTQKDLSIVNLFTNIPLGEYPWSTEEYNKLAIKDLEEVTGHKIRPNWIRSQIINYVSPIFKVGYKSLPTMLGPNLFLAGVFQTYPKFSSTGEAMANGEAVANELLQSIED